MFDRIDTLLNILKALPEDKKTSYTEGMMELAEVIKNNDVAEMDLYIEQFKKLLRQRKINHGRGNVMVNAKLAIADKIDTFCPNVVKQHENVSAETLR